MNCPFCGHPDNRVVDSRDVRSGSEIRRRRECAECDQRSTTYERVDELPTTDFLFHSMGEMAAAVAAGETKG